MTDVSQESHQITFSDWASDRQLISLGTNSGARTLPFQEWRKIKESFAPELIARAVGESPIPVERCIDPFGGSGTTGLACQFLGLHPIMAEVNPYLADLMEAKLTSYPSTDKLRLDLDTVIENVSRDVPVTGQELFPNAPRTFVEPGHNGRWIFGSRVADRIAAIRDAIYQLDDPTRRLFRVLLGGVLIDVSNVRVSGKGRRYRRSWQNKVVHPTQVEDLFCEAVKRAIEDIGQFTRRPVETYELLRGDSRVVLQGVEPCELAVFSPPYPNSFDYTDVYNVELWALGYLNGPQSNSILRSATLSSHVQISRDFASPPDNSATLIEVITKLEDKRLDLWNPNIPSMVGAYFSDLLEVLDHIGRILVEGGSAWMVVGDSRYAGVEIPVANVLEELACTRGWEILAKEPFRMMPTSPQQGGEKTLAEQLLVFRKTA